VTLEQALRISTTLAELDNRLAALYEQLREGDASSSQLLMADNARQSLSVLTESLRALGPPEG
jgi:hypothetical protein